MDVAIVPHTHWDREWYAPFQTYRLRLVQLLDEFLPLLEHDPGYRHFLLDGQTAVIDDYLEIRPDAEDRIRQLVTSGRLSIGPWMILMDEFMVSGETIVRNLQAGIRRAAEFGGAMEVGYLPDMFGHIAQMPQLLALAGFDHAVVWRGVPQEIAKTGFFWEAPDGSRVRAEYLYGSYSNGRDIPMEADGLVHRAAAYAEELGDVRLDGLLLMNGTDHQVPQPWLGQVVAAANATQDDFRFRVTSLRDHVLSQPTEGLPTWTGELRSGARSNVLMGVASNRVDVHQACAAAERALERRAEPLATLALPPERHPGPLLDVAWRNLILNSAHDSSCACSHDEVVEQVVVRYREARQIGDGIVRDVVKTLANEVAAPPGSTVVVNPNAHRRRGLVEVTVPGTGPLHFVDPDGAALPAQVVGEVSGDRFGTQVVGTKIGWVLDMLRGQEFAGAPVKGWDVETRADGAWDVRIHEAGPGDTRQDVGPLRERITELAAPGDSAVLHIRMLRAPARRALLATDAVPGFGWRAYQPQDGDVSIRHVTANGDHMRNEYVEVRVDAADGTFSLETPEGLRVAGLNRYVDGGDGGDTYNYSPPDDDREVSAPERVAVEIVEKGPLRALMVIRAAYCWPTHAEGDERSCTARAGTDTEVEITTTLELRTGEPYVRVHVEFDNPCRDHRLRAHFPLPARVEGSAAECAFAVVERGLTAEGGPNEFGLPTFPSRRFIDCSDGTAGLALVHDGLLEYEVVGDGTEVALTLLRAVGYLSRLEPQLRPNPAGPPVPVADAQMPGRQALDYAVYLHDGDWQAARLYEVADDVLVPLERAPVRSARGHRPPSGTFLEVTGAQVSACHRTTGGITLRMFNPTGETARATVRIPGSEPDGNGGAEVLVDATGWVTDLRGKPGEPFAGALDLRPGEIATLLLPA